MNKNELLSEYERAKKVRDAAIKRVDECKRKLDKYMLEQSMILKPCPFCGGKSIMRGTEGMDMHQHYWVACELEGCSKGWYDSELEAANKWNRRF